MAKGQGFWLVPLFAGLVTCGAHAAPAGPPTPAAPGVAVVPAGVDPADHAARVAIEDAETRSPTTATNSSPAAVPAGSASQGPIPAAGFSAPPATQPAPAVSRLVNPGPEDDTLVDLRGISGIAISALFLALALVFAWSQRKYFKAILHFSRRRTGGAAEVARLARLTAERKRALEGRNGSPIAGAAGPGAESAALKELSGELQQTLRELRMERERWERDWQEREIQWARWMRRAEDTVVAAGPEEERGMADPTPDAPVTPAGPTAILSRPSELLASVEEMLGQGLSAEEISRKLRVGLREIQWHMRLGAMEAHS